MQVASIELGASWRSFDFTRPFGPRSAQDEMAHGVAALRDLTALALGNAERSGPKKGPSTLPAPRPASGAGWQFGPGSGADAVKEGTGTRRIRLTFGGRAIPIDWMTWGILPQLPTRR
jgi:hypothetical protein